MGGDAMGKVWGFLGQAKNRAILGWIGSGLAVAAAGAWAVVTFAFPDRPAASGTGVACAQQGIAAGRDASHNTVTVNGAGGAGSLACADAGRN